MTSQRPPPHLAPPPAPLPSRRHLERPTRVWPFVMESLAETETEADESNEHNRSNEKVNLVPASMADKELRNLENGLSEPQPPTGCVPFFGVKHYLHNFYGLPDDPNNSKHWQQFGTDGDDGFDHSPGTRSSGAGRCGHRLRRACFGYSITLGLLISLLGITCLLLGYLLPRHPILVGQVEEEDLKMWIATHRQLGSAAGTNAASSVYPASGSLAILDKKAIEHNNLLDLLKIAGLIAMCTGSLVLVTALILPACRTPHHPHHHLLHRHWADGVGDPEDDDQHHISQLNQALKNCLRSIHIKTHSTVFYSGVVASTDEKIPVFQQLQSVQPRP